MVAVVDIGWTSGRENDDLDEKFYRVGSVARLQVSSGTAVIFSREPIEVGDGINKKHTADIHRGRFLSFVYHACSVHNCVGLAGKGWSVEQDRHRYATHYPPGYQNHSRAVCQRPRRHSLFLLPNYTSRVLRHTQADCEADLGPVVSTASGK